jgi:hypothetical protein
MNEFEFGDLTEEQLDYITEKDPEKLKELDKPFVSKGFQYFRDEILDQVKHLTFKEKFYVLKKNDEETLKIMNKNTGTKEVPTLFYLHKFPSRKKNLNPKEELILALRGFFLYFQLDEFYKERRKKLIRLVK